MSETINNISLPNFVVTELYSHVLVDLLPAEPSVPVKTEMNPVSNEEKLLYKEEGTSQQNRGADSISWLGENRNQVIILVNEPETGLLSGTSLNFLTGILAACKLDLADVAVINMNDHKNIAFKKIADKFRANIVLLFGTDPVDLDLPVRFPQFQVQQLAKTKFLSAPALHAFGDDKILKSKLWVSLRKIFGV
jgi:hypothetical protein